MPTRKYKLKRTAFIGCPNTSYMDVDDAEPCPFCGSRQVTIYPYGQGAPRMSRAYLRSTFHLPPANVEAVPPRLTVPNANRLSRARTSTTPVLPP